MNVKSFAFNQPNTWYEEAKTGEKMLYLGVASQHRLDGYWGYDLCHISLKMKVLLRVFPSEQAVYNTQAIDLLAAMVNKGVRCYFFNSTPRKAVKVLGQHGGYVLKGSCVAGDTEFRFN